MNILMIVIVALFFASIVLVVLCAEVFDGKAADIGGTIAIVCFFLSYFLGVISAIEMNYYNNNVIIKTIDGDEIIYEQCHFDKADDYIIIKLENDVDIYYYNPKEVKVTELGDD